MEAYGQARRPRGLVATRSRVGGGGADAPLFPPKGRLPTDRSRVGGGGAGAPFPCPRAPPPPTGCRYFFTDLTYYKQVPALIRFASAALLWWGGGGDGGCGCGVASGPASAATAAPGCQCSAAPAAGAQPPPCCHSVALRRLQLQGSCSCNGSHGNEHPATRGHRLLALFASWRNMRPLERAAAPLNSPLNTRALRNIRTTRRCDGRG